MNVENACESLAAFEVVSKISFTPFGSDSVHDFRSYRLPETKPIDDYDPRTHREHGYINTWMASFNLVRSVFGAAILGMPLAIGQAGIVLGPMMAVFIGIFIIHMHLMLINSLNEVCRQLRIPHISYRYGFRLALLHGPPIFRCIANRGPIIITTFMVLSQLGICTYYVIFCADSLRDVMDWSTSRTALLILIVPYVILEFFMKTLTIVSYVSLIGNLMTFAGLVIVLYHTIDDPNGEIMATKTLPVPLMLAIGTILFNLAAVGVILTLDRALKNPVVMVKRYGVMTISIFVATIVSTTVGVLGYWSFGTVEENILRSLPYDNMSTMLAIGLYLVAATFAFPIQCYPAVQVLLETIKHHNPVETPSDHTMQLIEAVVRPAFVFISFLLCYLVPFQAPFMAFVSTLCTTHLAFVFPALMEISLMYPGPYGKWKFYLVKDVIIIIIGIVTWILGIVLNGYLIYIRILATYSPNYS